MPEPKKEIFISYSHADASWANTLADAMALRGANVLSNKAETELGGEWLEIIRKEIEKASAFVLLIPAHGVRNRNNILFEAGVAKALGKRILAVLPPHHLLDREQLPFEIADIVVLDAGERPVESLADTLLQAVPEAGLERGAHTSASVG